MSQVRGGFILHDCPPLTSQDGTPAMLSVPVDSDKLQYGPYDPSAPDQAPHVAADGFREYKLPEDQALKPVRMEVHEARDVRGETPARISLLGRNRTALRTFSLPKDTA